MFNYDQLVNLFQSFGKIGFSALATHGAMSASNAQLWCGVLGAAFSFWLSHHSNATPATAAGPTGTPATATVDHTAKLPPVILCLICCATVAIFAGCRSSAVMTAYKTETAVDTATVTAWTLWQSYVTNSKINGNPVPAATQTEVSAAFQKVKAAELVAIDATALAASTTNSAAATQLTLTSTSLSSALTDLGTLLATFNIKL